MENIDWTPHREGDDVPTNVNTLILKSMYDVKMCTFHLEHGSLLGQAQRDS
jgi:hypothetical protein